MKDSSAVCLDRPTFKSKSASALSLLALISLIARPDAAFAQGSLTPPPGAPVPTMKTLDQIEPRTPVDTTHTPGNFSNQYLITQPGSYYLASNIVALSATYTITILAPNVTLDLNGFTISGVAGTYAGIYASNTVTANLAVRNGTVTGFTNVGNYAIESLARNATFENLIVSSNNVGLYVNHGSIVRNCVLSSNFREGVYVTGVGCLIAENTCVSNNLSGGASTGAIYLNNSSNRVDGNHVIGSGQPGFGIYVQPSATANIIVRNSVLSGTTNNYFANFNQIIGPLITNTASGFITNSNPWANFSY